MLKYRPFLPLFTPPAPPMPLLRQGNTSCLILTLCYPYHMGQMIWVLSLNRKTNPDPDIFSNLGFSLIRCTFSERSLCKTNISPFRKTWVKLRRRRLANSTWGKMPSILQGLYFLYLVIIPDQSHDQ